MAKDKFTDAVSYFCNLPQDDRRSFLDKLRELPPATTISSLSKALAEKTGTDVEKIEDLLRGFAPAIALCAADPKLRSTIAAYLVPAKSPKEAEVEAHLQELLSIEVPVSITSKAQDILWGHGHVFKDAHVMTQIRPIFTSDVAAKPTSAVVMHELRIGYTEGDENRSIHVSLDSRRIAELQQVLERALVKERSIVKAAGFTYIA